jgi:putative membrane protein
MLFHTLLHLVRGFAMGAADIVPGVSGGTIALVLGIYERLIASLRAGSKALTLLLRRDVAGFRRWLAAVEWAFIIPLGLGILAAVLSLARLISDQLHAQPELMSAIFLGLVAGSVVVALRLIHRPSAQHALIVALVGVITFVLLGIRGGTDEGSVGQIVEPALWAYFISGAVAICAMILPGVSGSFLLVIMGMYTPLLAAVTDRDVVTLAVFMLGAVVGLALFSQLLHVALQRAHDIVLAVLIGLMAGSVRVLWPWPDGVDSTELAVPEGEWPLAIGLALVAFVVVMVVARYAQGLEAADEHPDAEPHQPTEPSGSATGDAQAEAAT